ncbi:MAG: hypothetical protein ACI9GJ_000670, partial [Parasphingorhabdus sp.]
FPEQNEKLLLILLYSHWKSCWLSITEPSF